MKLIFNSKSNFYVVDLGSTGTEKKNMIETKQQKGNKYECIFVSEIFSF